MRRRIGTIAGAAGLALGLSFVGAACGGNGNNSGPDFQQQQRPAVTTIPGRQNKAGSPDSTPNGSVRPNTGGQPTGNSITPNTFGSNTTDATVKPG